MTRLFRTNTHHHADGSTTVTTFDVEWVDVRASRDACLTTSDLWMLPDRYETLTTAQKAALTTYRAELRDLPTKADPNTAVDEWPEKPDFVDH